MRPHHLGQGDSGACRAERPAGGRPRGVEGVARGDAPTRRARRRLLLAAALAALAAWPAAARADLWTDMVGATVTPSAVEAYGQAGEAGVLFRGPAMRLPSGGGGTAASVSLQGRRGCGAMDFAAEFQALFNANAFEDYLKGVASAAISSAPLVLMCYASPTLCDAYKHFRQMASGLLQLKAAECQAVEQAAMGAGERMRKRQELSCVEERVAAGTPMYQALDECKRPDIKLVGYDLRPADTLEVVGGVLDKLGVDPELRDLGKAVLGDVRLTAGGGREVSLPSPATINAVWGQTYDAYVGRLERALEAVSAGRTLSAEDAAAISPPGRPITAADLRRLLQLEAGARAVAVQRLAAALTMARLGHQLNELRAALAQGARLAEQTTQSTPELERAIEALEAALARLRDLKADTDAVNDVLAAVAADAARARQETVGVVAPAVPPRAAAAAGPSSGGLRLGGGLMLRPR